MGHTPDPGADDEAVARLLGRPPACAFRVVVRRPDGMPVVIENAPLLEDGRPMPTRYWLVDPALREAVSRLEAAGGVRQAAAAVSAESLAEAHTRYAALRARSLPAGHQGPVPSGGVGGTRRGVKCLHAHLAWYLAGGDDPVGRWTAERLGGLPDGLDPSRTGPVAAVDCGTNSTRLIVVDADGSVLEREMRITRLGQGVDATRVLSADAIERTLAVLRDYREIMDRHAVVRARVVATSAARDAGNAEEFMAAAQSVMGVRPEVLSGDEEGRVSFMGATAHVTVPKGQSPVLVTDIGGGSTELSVGYPAEAVEVGKKSVVTRSMDVGCVRVSERFLRHDPPWPEEIDEARTAVEKDVMRARDELPVLGSDSLFIGLAGTVSTLTSLVHGLATYDRAAVHHSTLSRRDVEQWLAVLSGEKAEARLAHPGMVHGREDVIVGGAIVLAAVMAVFERDRCLVSEDDILDGLASDLLSR